MTNLEAPRPPGETPALPELTKPTPEPQAPRSGEESDFISEELRQEILQAQNESSVTLLGS